MYSWDPTIVGFSTNPPNAVYRYKKTGKTATLFIMQPTNGTSNNTRFTISLPIPAKSIDTTSGLLWNSLIAQTINNGTVNTTTPGIAIINSGDTIVSLLSNLNGSLWTASGGKRVPYCQISYEIDG